MKKYNDFLNESLVDVLKTPEYWKPIFNKINSVNKGETIIKWDLTNLMKVNYNREIVIAYSYNELYNDPETITQNVNNVVDELNNDDNVKKFYNVTYEQIFDQGKTYLKYAINFKLHPHIRTSLDHGLI